MKEKLLSLFLILLIIGFSFFYTNKAVKLAKNTDPIMKEIINIKKVYKIDKVFPKVKNDEYVFGINGCIIDEDKSYNKMKKIGTFDENLLIMKEDKIYNNSTNKYIISGNKENKNISIIMIINEKIDDKLIKFIKDNKIKINFFVDTSFLENNLEYIKKISKYGNIYNYGRDNNYDEKYIVYDNNLINSITNLESNYCLTNKKDNKLLKICNKNNMNVIKNEYISENVLEKIKYSLGNGKIITVNNINNNIINIKVSINFILSKGYNIVYLNELLTSEKDCNLVK